MTNESPASIIFDTQGNPIGVVLDGTIYRLQVEATISEATKKVVYDIGDTIIYVGTAILGTATNTADWLIKTTLTNGVPTLTQWSSNTAIWDNRSTESYS